MHRNTCTNSIVHIPASGNVYLPARALPFRFLRFSLALDGRRRRVHRAKVERSSHRSSRVRLHQQMHERQRIGENRQAITVNNRTVATQNDLHGSLPTRFGRFLPVDPEKMAIFRNFWHQPKNNWQNTSQKGVHVAVCSSLTTLVSMRPLVRY